LILKYLPDYSPVHYYLASQDFKVSVYAEDIMGVFTSEGSFDKDELKKLLTTIIFDHLVANKTKKEVFEKLSEQMLVKAMNYLEPALKEFTSVRTPNFKK